MKHIWTTPVQNLEMNVYQYGDEDCKPGHAFGPAVRDHFLLHFVIEGQGSFATENRRYHLSREMGFLIYPEKITTYRADRNEPWRYFWIGFSGGNAAGLLTEIGLSPACPVFCFGDGGRIQEIFGRLRDLRGDSVAAQLQLTSALFALLSEISPATGTPADTAYRLFHSGQNYAEAAARYMGQCYASPLTVSGVAEHLGLHRSYFSTLFRRQYGCSPQQYLQQIRIDKAAELLRRGAMSVTEISRTVGYEDPLLFSRIFKKVLGLSPRAYRQVCKAVDHQEDAPV